MKLSALVSLMGLLASATAAPISLAKRGLPRLGGVNIAGCEFGINVWGWSGASYCPGTEQITHFINAGSNVIRLPFGWQYMTGNDVSATSLDAGYLAQFDALVQTTTSAGAYAILDLHNYGRWDSGVVGVDGPSNADFARLWSLLAKKYASNPKVMFGLMNEPHDQDISVFARAAQEAVDAIRAAGATTQTIILPGNSWDNAGVWASGANAPMLAITDPAAADSSLLLLDVHKYIDADGSGTSHECTNDGLDLLQPLVTYLKQQGRRAIVTEIGGANTASCRSYLPKTMQYLVDNDDVIAGFTAWSGGAFEPYPGYELSIVPNADGSDNELFTTAIKPFLPGANAAPVTPSKAVSTSAAPTTSAAPVASSKAPVVSVAPPTSVAPVVPSQAPVSSSAAPIASSAAPVASSAAPVPSSAAPVPSSAAPVQSSAAPVQSSVAPVASAVPSPIPSAGPVQSSAPQPSVPAVAGNYQTFTEALGGFTAPAVTKSGNYYFQSGQQYNFLIDALNQSCYKQMDDCQLAANRGGNVEPLTVANCNGKQIAACLAAASTAAQ